MIITLYLIFILYVSTRIILKLKYKKAEKKHAIAFYKLQEETFPIMIDSLKEANEGWDNNKYNKECLEQQKICRRLYQTDTFIKRVGALILAMVSVIGVIINIENIIQAKDILLVLLPGVVNLFNTFYEFFEINLPTRFEIVFPQKPALK